MIEPDDGVYFFDRADVEEMPILKVSIFHDSVNVNRHTLILKAKADEPEVCWHSVKSHPLDERFIISFNVASGEIYLLSNSQHNPYIIIPDTRMV